MEGQYYYENYEDEDDIHVDKDFEEVPEADEEIVEEDEKKSHKYLKEYEEVEDRNFDESELIEQDISNITHPNQLSDRQIRTEALKFLSNNITLFPFSFLAQDDRFLFDVRMKVKCTMCGRVVKFSKIPDPRIFWHTKIYKCKKCRKKLDNDKRPTKKPRKIKEDASK